jgi:DNA polymerase I-like protein with 3'-5' exonuclease and polymerase domains
MTTFQPDDVVTLDVETSGLEKDAKLLGLGYYETRDQRNYITEPEQIKIFFGNSQYEHSLFAAHNGKYDQVLLHRKTGVLPTIAFDTYLAATLLPLDKRPKELKLDTLANYYYGVPSWKDKEFLENIATQPPDQVAYYNTYDCFYTKKLTRTLWDLLLEAGTLGFFLNVVMPTANMLAGIESRGVGFDTGMAEDMQRELLGAIKAALIKLGSEYSTYTQDFEQGKLNEWIEGRTKPPTAGEIIKFTQKESSKFNWSSPKQILWLLKDCLGFDCQKWDRAAGQKKASVDEEVLKRYEEQHPIFKQLLQLRGMEKLDGYFKQWLSAVDQDARLRAHYHQDTVRLGGRLSSSGPNLQQVPRPTSTHGIWRDKNCRQLFRAAPGHRLVKLDFRQVEPRLLAHYAEDKKLIAAFSAEEDFYKVVIADALGLKIEEVTKEQRSAGKTLGLAIAYGAMAKKVAQIINTHLNLHYDYIEGQRCVDRWWAARRPFDRLKRILTQQVAERGYIETFMGRRVYLDAKLAEMKKAEGKQLNLLNTIAQVSAGDLLNYATVCLLRAIQPYGIKAEVVMLVHDEAVWEVEEHRTAEFEALAEDVMCSQMVKRFNLDVPLGVESKVGQTWGG